VPELAANLVFYARHGAPPLDDKALALLDPPAREVLDRIAKLFADPQLDWTETALEAAVKALAEEVGVKLGKIAQPLRAALTGSTVSPGIFEVLAILGRDESLLRIEAAARVP
jgi:glutamyl-tRNA synthetase